MEPIEALAARGAVLTRDILKDRLKKDLVVSPLLEEDQVGEGSIDISLGTQFIVNQRPQVTYIDPQKLQRTQLRKIQQFKVVPFNGEVVLHPGAFLLGCTLEFISLPGDVCGFVLSRSSYGRAGLLVATATYIHPYWQGCLTLELENLGDVPISLRPGYRIGQLVLLTSAALRDKPKFKSIPVGPAFSDLKENVQWANLRENRSTSAGERARSD